MANKVLGKAKYHATRVGGVTTLTAVGTFPNFNDKADIEQLPILIFPPQFAFYFIHQDISLPALRPFTYSEIISFPKNSAAVMVRDADGLHPVPITEIALPEPTLHAHKPTDTGFCVYSVIGTNHLHLAKCEAILPTIYHRVFGPATHAECEKYIANNGGK